MRYCTPEEKIIKQNSRETEAIYFISKGVCRVTQLQKEDGKTKLEYIRELRSSDYFGEISLVMDCIRTANVSSINYSTLGSLDLKTLYKVCSNHDYFLWALLSKVYSYDDSIKMFL